MGVLSSYSSSSYASNPNGSKAKLAHIFTSSKTNWKKIPHSLWFCFSHYFQGDFSYFSYRAPKAILAQWYVYCIFPCLCHLENTSLLELRRASGGMLSFWVVCQWAWRQPACSSPQKASVLMSLPLTFPHQSICRNHPGLERDTYTAPEKQGTFFQ